MSDSDEEKHNVNTFMTQDVEDEEPVQHEGDMEEVQEPSTATTPYLLKRLPPFSPDNVESVAHNPW
eukprot:CAMPEP_0175139786 /NCGR_PEP_ID=MMETSP0087-20121206/11107_1 /TAXON_ID=136419 /ORGANISM="Unknown Unknown, Strain D1" /LENGTH=65 /DNA_ID=CAMNT_0016422857 /DNA_START=99 /DNA_END=296 /DNA_ORIENTATION=-